MRCTQPVKKVENIVISRKILWWVFVIWTNTYMYPIKRRKSYSVFYIHFFNESMNRKYTLSFPNSLKIPKHNNHEQAILSTTKIITSTTLGSKAMRIKIWSHYQMIGLKTRHDTPHLELLTSRILNNYYYNLITLGSNFQKY